MTATPYKPMAGTWETSWITWEGLEQHAVPRQRRCRFVFQRLGQEWAAAVNKKWADTAHFAIMMIEESKGTALECCPLVVVIFAQKTHRNKLAKVLWATVDKTLNSLAVEHMAQQAAYNKVRIGLPSADVKAVLRQMGLPELSTGMRIKDERTQQFLSTYEDDVDAVASSGTGSEAREGYHHGGIQRTPWCMKSNIWRKC